MEETYYLKARKTCSTCGGERIIYNGIWNEFAAFDKALRERTDLDSPELENQHEGEIFQWWQDHGCPVDSWTTFNSMTPPEEDTCPDCEGSGIEEREVDLCEALGSIDLLASNFGVEELKHQLSSLRDDYNSMRSHYSLL